MRSKIHRGTPLEALLLGGVFDAVCRERGKIMWRDRVKNGVTTAGLNALLDIMFHGSTQITTWYLGLVANSGFSAFAAADTMSSHSGWSEDQNYGEAARVAWTEGAAASGSITSSGTSDFTMNATTTIKGLFVNSVSTKGGTTGTLWSTGAFASARSLINGQILQLSYTVTASGS